MFWNGRTAIDGFPCSFATTWDRALRRSPRFSRRATNFFSSRPISILSRPTMSPPTWPTWPVTSIPPDCPDCLGRGGRTYLPRSLSSTKPVTGPAIAPRIGVANALTTGPGRRRDEFHQPLHEPGNHAVIGVLPFGRLLFQRSQLVFGIGLHLGRRGTDRIQERLEGSIGCLLGPCIGNLVPPHDVAAH